MNYKPDEKMWMAYLYGELSEEEKKQFDQYLLENAGARETLAQYQNLRHLMSEVRDKEVIAPPLVLGDGRRFLWDFPYFRTIVSIAASLLLILLAGKLTDTRITAGGNGINIAFGDPKPVVEQAQPSLTQAQVQQMIDQSLLNNNNVIAANWKENEEKLTASIRQNLAVNSGRIDKLVREASNASQDQIRDYVASMQTQNMAAVKDYFQLTSAEQKNYIENLLVDFAEYLQQQRNNDLQVVQTRLNSIEQNTDIFKQETEQILTSIISTVGSPASTETRN